MNIKKIKRPTIKAEIIISKRRYVRMPYDLSSKISFYEFMESNFLLVETIPYKGISLAKRVEFKSQIVIYKEIPIDMV